MAAAALDRLFLFACSVAEPGDWAGKEEALRSLQAEDWKALADSAVFHGFPGLLARNLGWAEARIGTPVPIVEPLSALRRGQLVQHLGRKAAARRVADALDRAGIPFIALKGIALAEEVYGDLSLRGFHDFDVMVPMERLDDAWSVICGLGYRSPQFDHVRDWVRHGAHAAGMAHPDGNGVDLHWSFAPDVLDPARIGVVWKHCRRPAPGSHLPGLRLSHEMTLIHLAKHFHSHQYGSVKALVDFHVAARSTRGQLDPGALVATARALELLPVVDIVARLCERVFVPGSLPPILGSRPPGVHARIARTLLDDHFLVHSAELPRITNWLRYLAAAGGLRASIESVFGFLVPGRLLLTRFFGRPFEPSMYPVYYWRQLRKVVTLSNK